MDPGPEQRAPVDADAASRARVRIERANERLALLERALWPRPIRSPERIGVLRHGMLGDVAVALPALEALRRAHPRAKLVLLTSPGPRGGVGAAELLAGVGHVEVFRWHAEDIATVRGRAALLRRVRALALDLVVALPAAMTTPRREAAHAAFLRLAGVGAARGFAVANARWIGDADARRAHDAENEGAAAWDARGDRPQALRLLRHVDLALRSAGARGIEAIEPPDAAAFLALREDEHASARDALVRAGLSGAPLLALVPGAKLATKRWPPESFASVASDWITGGGEVALIGSAAERPLADAILSALSPHERLRVADTTGAFGVRKSAAVIACAAACVSNDSGPAHVAAALGTPLVVVQSARDRRGAWDPAGPGPIRVLRARVPCGPCFLDACPERLACLTAFDPPAVSAAIRALARPRSRRRPGTETARAPVSSAP